MRGGRERMAGMKRPGVGKVIPLATFVAAILISFASSLLFRINGGFGGGHGPYDTPIFILALPWVFVANLLPESAMAKTSDFVLFVIVPALFNLGSSAVLAAFLRKRNLG